MRKITDHTSCDIRPCVAGVAVPIAFSSSCREIAVGNIITDCSKIYWFAYRYHGLHWYRIHTITPQFNANSVGFLSIPDLCDALRSFARSLHGTLFGINYLKEVR